MVVRVMAVATAAAVSPVLRPAQVQAMAERAMEHLQSRRDVAKGTKMIEDALQTNLLPPAVQATFQEHLGAAYAMSGRTKEAISVMRASLSFNPAVGNLNYNLGIVLSEVGQTAEAEAFYRAATRLEPKIEGAHNKCVA